MKTCPRCGALAFDDAKVCFGCLYDYSALKDHMNDGFQQINASNNSSMRIPMYPNYACKDPNPPEFCIRFVPRHTAWDVWEWDCSVQVKEGIRHEVVGRHAV